jgi:hypothetical protein
MKSELGDFDSLIQKLKNRLARHYLPDRSDRLIYVHIGKCGGSSLGRAISHSKVLRREFRAVAKFHIKKPPITKNAKYLIVVRNPIDRAVSAFNWRYRLVVDEEKQKDRFDNEWKILTKYGTLNSLSEALYVEGHLDSEVAQDFNSIHHLRENISFYLGDLLQSISSEQIYGVLATETLNQDIMKILGVHSVARVHENSRSVDLTRGNLSDDAIENLKRFLASDYKNLQILLEMNQSSTSGVETLCR